MKSLTKWLVVVAVLAIAASAFAIPAKPRPTTLTQPDGSKFTAVLKGDEHFHFAEDADGFSIIQDKNGWWTYAKQENGLLVASKYKVGHTTCPYSRHLRPSAEAVAALPENVNKIINVPVETRHKWSTDFLYGVGRTKENPSKAATGRNYMNMVLGDFSDSTFAWYSGTQKAGQNPYGPFPYDASAANNHALANTNFFWFIAFGDSTSPYVPDSSKVGSMSNYYFDFTYRKCWWYGAVSAIVPTGVARASAVASGGAPSSTYYNAALSGADASINYDNDGNGVADNLILVHPGPGQEETGDTKDIWSMSMTGSFGTRDGVSITKLIVCPQNGQLGVFAHEMFHQIGGPDLYDYGYSGTPWGEWSLMDNGSWNGQFGGDQPAFPGGHLTYDVDGFITTGPDGWINLTVNRSDSISSAYLGDGQYTIAALDSAGEARRGNITSGIRLWRIRNNNFRDSAQVFFVELRQRTPPYEVGLPEDGLIITHIDTRMGGGTRFNDGPPCVKYYYSWVEQPGINPNLQYVAGDSNFPRQLANAAYSAEDISGGGYVENAIDSLTTPNCKTNKDNAYGPWIYDISKEGATMTFKVARTGLVTAPVVGYISAQIKDPILANTANNNNSMLDPWETDSLKINFRNTGTAITAGARCSLYAYGASAAYVQIFDPTPGTDGLTAGWQAVNGGVLGANAEGLSLPFVLQISKDIPKFTDLNFTVKFSGTTPAYTTTSNFVLRVGGFKVDMVYDFQNIRVGGTTYNWRLMPCDLAIYRDTLIVANANLDGATFQTRIYKVKRNTTNKPLVGGAGGDTLGSLNNKVTTQVNTMYVGGIDVDNSGNLWYTIQDSVWNTNRGTTKIKSFRAPNVSWAGTPMKRVRGLGIGPLTVDTVGTDCLPGDSLVLYWQNYYDATAAGSGAESLYVVNKAANNVTATRTRAYAFNDSAWGAISYGGGNGYSWWNGRAADYDGSNLWTSSVWMNILIRRTIDGGTASSDTAVILETMPGPSTYGSYGTYGIALESTDSLGVQYAPSGSVAYVPGKKGTRHYMYCASMDEGKIYKLDITNWMLPTPPDSVKVTDTGADNRIDWWKANDNQQKVYQYIIYRQAPGTTTPPSSADELVRVQNVYGGPTTHTYTDVGAGAKAAYVYSIKSVNYYGEGTWGASVSASPLAVTVTDFAFTTSQNIVTLNWSTASELNNLRWDIERSSDGQNFTLVGSLPAKGSSAYGFKYSYNDAVPAEGIYHYNLYDVSTSGERKLSGQLLVNVGKVPMAYELSQNYPNPVGRGATKIAYALKNPGQTSLKIYNILGEEVRTLVNGKQDAAFYTVYWDGNDNANRQVSNGVYFYKLVSGEFEATRKITVLR